VCRCGALGQVHGAYSVVKCVSRPAQPQNKEDICDRRSRNPTLRSRLRVVKQHNRGVFDTVEICTGGLVQLCNIQYTLISFDSNSRLVWRMS
jgi:hypothetical protein